MRLEMGGGTWAQALPTREAAEGTPWPREKTIPGGDGAEFGKLLTGALERTNQMLVQADRQAEMVATGQSRDLNTAVLAIEKAHLALQLTMAVTNRAVEAYKEIIHMQV